MAATPHSKQQFENRSSRELEYNSIQHEKGKAQRKMFVLIIFTKFKKLIPLFFFLNQFTISILCLLLVGLVLVQHGTDATNEKG